MKKIMILFAIAMATISHAQGQPQNQPTEQTQPITVEQASLLNQRMDILEGRMSKTEKHVNKLEADAKKGVQVVKVVRLDLNNLTGKVDTSFDNINKSFELVKNGQINLAGSIGLTKDTLKILKDSTNKQLKSLKENKADSDAVKVGKFAGIGGGVLAVIAILLIFFKRSGNSSLS